ncbi:MAG: hypothetical protein ACUZ8A_03755 [Candidatus Bathyanammoxibius sp.]
MAEVRLAPERVVQAGLTATYTGSLLVANNYKVRNTGRTILHFLKTAAGICDVTIVTPKIVNGLGVADQAVEIPATSGDKVIGPFPRGTFNDGVNDIEFTLATTVNALTVAVLEI